MHATLRSTALALCLLTLVFAAVPASAEPENDCPTWLPDLSCDREGRWEGFSAPVTSPYLFEDPFNTTGVSIWAIYHKFPGRSVFGGGHARVFAVQARLALTDRLGLIATKDGWINIRPNNDLLDSEKGYGDLGLGLKYVLYKDEERGILFTPALRYETTNGTRDVLMGNGEGVWIPSASSAFRVGDFHVLLGGGARLPLDGDAESTVGFYNAHVDTEVAPGIAPFIEMSGLHYIHEGDGTNTVKLGSGARLPWSVAQTALGLSGFEGADAFNLGSDNVRGNDVITGAIGLRAQVTERASIGIAYEHPLTRRKDITQNRITLNLLLEL